MTHASLFTGFGGFDLAAHWMGWTNRFQVEWDEFCQLVLAQHFPGAERYRNVRDFKGQHTARHANRIDVLSGGFPCQPYSHAGQRRGKADDRHLWPEMRRIIGEVQPRYVVGENVRGLTTWGDGLVVDEVLADLEAEGYRTFPPLVIPACGQNAPHRRDRVWFVAYSDGAERSRNYGAEHEGQAGEVRRNEAGDVPVQRGIAGPAAGAGGSGGRGTGENGEPGGDLGSVAGSWWATVAHPPRIGERSGADSARRDIGGGQFMEGPGQGCDGNNDGEGGAATNAARIGEREQGHKENPFTDRGEARGELGWISRGRTSADAAGIGAQGRWSDRIQQPQRPRETGLLGRDFAATYWTKFPTVTPVRARNDGVPHVVVRHTDGTSSRYHAAQVENRIRKEAIKGAGNAIVPHMAVAIFTAIEYVEAQRRRAQAGSK